MPLTDKQIGEMLLKESFVSEEELANAVGRAKELKSPLIDILIDQGLLTQKLYEEALAEHFKMPFYDSVSSPPAPEVIGLLPEEIARNYSAVVVKKKRKLSHNCDCGSGQ